MGVLGKGGEGEIEGRGKEGRGRDWRDVGAGERGRERSRGQLKERGGEGGEGGG